jgi:PAS domain S-box-containing protein
MKMQDNNISLPTRGLSVKELMDVNIELLKPTDTLRKVVESYHGSKLNILPVVDDSGKLVGGFPKKRLFRAILDGASLELPCKNYMVRNPIYINENLHYDEVSFVFRIGTSKVDSVIVLNNEDKVVGTIGMAEYLRASLNLLVASSATLESMFRVNHEGIVIIDSEGYIQRINPAAEMMFDLVEANVQGKLLSDVLPEITATGEPQSASQSAGYSGAELQSGKVFYYKRTINSLPLLINTVPIIEEGVHIGSSFAFLDISDVEQIAKELEIVRDMQSTIEGIINASSDGVFVSDPDGTIRYVNEKACELLLRKSDKIINQSIQSILHTNSPTKVSDSNPAIVDTLEINRKKCFVSHTLYKSSVEEDRAGIVSTIFLGDSKLTEEMAHKWFDLNREVEFYKTELERRHGDSNDLGQIVSTNPSFEKIKKDALHISRSSSTVLLTGESGVGKSMFARGIHEASPRAGEPFVVVNCVSIPESLFEAELFGYAAGAFTGALKSGKSGYFERADKGTIFMDEIGDIPLDRKSVV